MRSNVVTLVGNLGADPVYRRFDTGTEVTNLRVACTERRLDRSSGQWVDGATSWWSVSCWRSLAANTAASLRRGDRVVVTGVVKAKQWERDGRTGTSLEVDAEAVGHDLAWGRSRFERVVRSQELPLPGTPAADPGDDAGDGAGAEEVAASLGQHVDEHGVLTGADDFAHAYEDADTSADEDAGEHADEGADRVPA